MADNMNFWDYASMTAYIENRDKWRADHPLWDRGHPVKGESGAFAEIEETARNTMASWCELIAWQLNPPTVGEKYSAYLSDAAWHRDWQNPGKWNATTWMGDRLLNIYQHSSTYTRRFQPWRASHWETYKYWYVWARDYRGFVYRGIATDTKQFVNFKRIK